MKKKKKKTPDVILAKAEKLFEKENYVLARKEFLKANKTLQHPDIEEKIRICEKESKGQKAKDLIKKGRKNAKKGNLQGAITCFEAAFEISDAEWLQERISELKTELSGQDSLKAAKDAEASGKYEDAALLYEAALETQENDEDIRCKSASSLVKAGKYGEAVSIFRDIPARNHESLYDYGFALAKTGRYCECLKVWDKIVSEAAEFREQRAWIQSLLLRDIYERFDHRWEDLPGVCEESQYLSDTADQHELSDFVAYCQYERIGQLWAEERYEAIAEFLLPYPAQMPPELLTIYAKVFFRLAERSGEYLPHLKTFWLTALYHPEIYPALSEDEDARAEVRQRLIQRAENLIRQHADARGMSAERALASWNAEKQAVGDTDALVSGREDLACPVCTPQFAKHFGLSEPICALIRENRDFFSDTEHYLLTGGCYSAAGQSLLCLEDREYEASLASLPESGFQGDEFLTYCVERVHFAYGLHCLEKGDNQAVRYFDTAAALFEKSPKYEKIFIDKAIDTHKADLIRLYENALNDIHAKHPTRGIKKALSLVMVRHAIDRHNQGQISLKSVKALIKKALKLDPENELGLNTLKSMQVSMEMEELRKAIRKHKINRACQIAAKSEHSDVKESFFEFIRYNIEHLDESDMDEREQLLLLNDFSKWCARVDESHSLLYEIDKRLALLTG